MKKTLLTLFLLFATYNLYSFDYLGDWQQNTGNTGFTSPFAIHGTITKTAGTTNYVYIFGSNADIYLSINNRDYTAVTLNAAYGIRESFSTLYYDNKMWVIAGSDGSSKNDVWSSTDGIDWTLVTGNAAFLARNYQAGTVFDDKMWIIGGLGGLTGALNNDVWYSTDGVDWTLATGNANWSPRDTHRSVVFDNKIWVIAGDDWVGSPSYNNDVWYSTDGVDWTLATGNANWSSRTYFGILSVYNRMWLIGGFIPSTSSYINEIWSSADGISWTQDDYADWIARAIFGYYSTTFTSNVYVVGGELAGLTQSDAWQAAANTFTSTPTITPTSTVTPTSTITPVIAKFISSQNIFTGEAKGTYTNTSLTTYTLFWGFYSPFYQVFTNCDIPGNTYTHVRVYKGTNSIIFNVVDLAGNTITGDFDFLIKR